MSRQTIEIIFLLLIMAVITISWYKNEKSVWKSFLFTAFTCGIFYLNSPNFLSIIDGTQLKTPFLSLPFTLYDKWGTVYIIITNLLLALVGVYLGQENNKKCNSWKIKKRFDHFVSDATSLKVIGRDLDFLLDDNNEDYRIQRSKIRTLGNHAKLLCARTDDEYLINFYHNLLKSGSQIRSYTSRDGIANLKGQIKINEHNETSGLFVLKTPHSTHLLSKITYIVANLPIIGKKFSTRFDLSNLFEIVEMENSYLLNAVDEQFDRTFEKSLHPVIRCIALDLGGVYFDGNIDTFYEYLKTEHNIVIKKKAKDRLNIDNDLMLGKISIIDFIKKRGSPKSALDRVDDNNWDDILSKWQDIWHPNNQVKAIVSSLHEFGYHIVPFSNLDQQNGEKYIRDHYLPDCCTTRFFSYERKKSKPAVSAFKDFTNLVKEKGFVKQPYQILLIDDESSNLEIAVGQGWETLKFYNDPNRESISELIQKLKQINILPEDYSLN